MFALSRMCLSAFISVQVLEAHGLRPISLKPKEVAFKSDHTVKYLSLPSVHWEHTVVKFMDLNTKAIQNTSMEALSSSNRALH